MSLFDDKERTDTRPSGQSEIHSKFLDRVGGEYWDQVRGLLNEWFEHLADDQAKAGIRGRIKSRDDLDFSSALAELYVHEMLIRDGFEVAYEPLVPGTVRRPDFLASRGAAQMYVEVTSRRVWDKGGAAAMREAVLHDAINTMNSPNFTLSFEVARRGPNSPSPRAIKRALTEWLHTLDPDQVLPLIVEQGLRAMPELTFDRNGWEIVFGALPIRREHRGVGDYRRAIGISGGGGGVVNDAEAIREALADKTHAYGQLNAPYVIALGLDHIRPQEVEAALFGGPSLHVVTPNDGNRSAIPGRDSRGYWSNGNQSRRSRVSGMVVLPSGLPYKVAEYSPTFWLNPNAVGLVRTPAVCDEVRVAGSQLQITEATTNPWKFFDLPEGWPVGDPWPKSGRT